ncbi:Gfo/Idh/MocA family protein [Natrononativus amylolyticus]|uniref:Gfo/Idh/MocA family protein n=1 Tax=Natrononativus amylolyticus TaxID=2963434 RepID=UPI0020CEA1F5|nr:Gfo/Idh/MocA family oxidoreductase [Natrononativus amylolyticus]
MIEVGVLGLDTSHPEKFASILGDCDDVSVAGVWDDGKVRDETYTNEFCADHGADRYDDPYAMIDDVDAAMILTVDWCSHRTLSVPFLEAGVPTMIDKPLAGSITDIDAIEAAAIRSGTPLYGGSAVPFHPDLAALTTMNPKTVFCSGYGDPFYYGVHLVDTVRSLLESDWTRIEPVDGAGRVAVVHFVDGSTATLRFDGPEEEGTFAFLGVGDRTKTVHIESTVDELERMYGPFVDGFLEAVRGERDDRERLIDGARLLLGLQAAFEDGESVPLDDVAAAASAFDSTAFLANYEPYY